MDDSDMEGSVDFKVCVLGRGNSVFSLADEFTKLFLEDSSRPEYTDQTAGDDNNITEVLPGLSLTTESNSATEEITGVASAKSEAAQDIESESLETPEIENLGLEEEDYIQIELNPLLSLVESESKEDAIPTEEILHEKMHFIPKKIESMKFDTLQNQLVDINLIIYVVDKIPCDEELKLMKQIKEHKLMILMTTKLQSHELRIQKLNSPKKDFKEDLKEGTSSNIDANVENEMPFETVFDWKDHIDKEKLITEMRNIRNVLENMRAIRLMAKEMLEEKENIIKAHIRTVEELVKLASELDQLHINTNKVVAAGASTSIVGVGLIIAGFTCAVFTLGSSLTLSLAGVGVSAGGGLMSSGANLNEIRIEKRKYAEAQKAAEDYKRKLHEFNRKYRSVLGMLSAMNNSYNATLVLLETFNVTVFSFLYTSAAVTTSTLGILTFTVKVAFLPIDIYTLCRSTQIVVNNEKTDIANTIRGLIAEISNSNLPEKLDIIEVELQKLVSYRKDAIDPNYKFSADRHVLNRIETYKRNADQELQEDYGKIVDEMKIQKQKEIDEILTKVSTSETKNLNTDDGLAAEETRHEKTNAPGGNQGVFKSTWNAAANVAKGANAKVSKGLSKIKMAFKTPSQLDPKK